ncbi:MAG: CoA transferase [Proteobacteria bacterium]|nr:CoA transferase [Pseudomonadota bacterium]
MHTYKPLNGTRVLSFELAFSLPAGTRALHDLGADVVRVSPPERQQDRYISVIDGVFHGKSSIAIDLTNAAGRDIAFDLAMQADVVCNNFRPSVLAKYGLDAARLRQAKPALIWLQLSGYGSPGPWSDFPAFGPSTEAAGGMNYLMVDEDETPFRVSTGVFADQLSGRYAALAITAALMKRQETGQGATIDLSMTACITHLIGESMTRASVQGHLPEYRGNRDPRFVPQGIYRSVGDDEWISISVVDDERWQRLCALIGVAGLDPHATRQMRWADHDSIDEIISSWSKDQNKDDLTRLLQTHGIAAAPVRTVVDSALDEQFKARGALQPVRHRKAKLGYTTHPHPPLPWRVIGRRRRKLTDYRHTGQDNARVLKRWLNMHEDAVLDLEKAGVLAREPALDLRERPASRQRDPQHASKLGLDH